jgi:hypothetical protein
MSEGETRIKRCNWDRSIAGPQRPGATQRIAVYGGSSEPAYSRCISAKPVKYTCAWCGQEKMEYRYPGKKPGYCSEFCRQRAAEERNAQRVKKQREKRQETKKARTDQSDQHR